MVVGELDKPRHDATPCLMARGAPCPSAEPPDTATIHASVTMDYRPTNYNIAAVIAGLDDNAVRQK